MKKNIEKFLKATFSLALITAILGGGLIFLLFLVSLIMGGAGGESLATSAANDIMPIFIRLASVAILSGLAWIYLKGQHSLSMKDGD